MQAVHKHCFFLNKSKKVFKGKAKMDFLENPFLQILPFDTAKFVILHHVLDDKAFI